MGVSSSPITHVPQASRSPLLGGTMLAAPCEPFPVYCVYFQTNVFSY